MRIGIDLSPLNHSWHRGIGVYARSLLGAMAPLGDEHEIVLLAPHGLARIPGLAHARWYTLPDPSIGRASAIARGQVAVPLLARALRLDVLHVIHTPVNPSQPAAPFLSPVPLVVTVHDLTPLHARVILRKRRWRTFYSLVLWRCRRAAAIVADSLWTGEDIVRRRIAAPDRVFVAPLAAPPLAEVPPGFTAPQGPYALNVGSDDWNKNRDTLMRAFASTAERSDLRLVLVGGSAPTGLSEALRSRVDHRVHVPEGELAGLYRHARMFVFPSRYEGFGLPILEAMRAGVPVLTSDRGAMRETAGGAALLVDPEDSDALATAMLTANSDETLRETLRDAGPTRARQFTWERTARTTLLAYRAALEGSAV